MCISAKAPDLPAIPERQATKLPDNGSTASVTDAMAKRRRGLYASILTSPTGTTGGPATTSRTTLG